MKSNNASVIDVDEREFEDAVIERSRNVPIVVDFWAPWCGPCRTLGPTLERLADQAQGAFVLAKVNVDQNQRLATRYGIQGIPAVKAFRDGVVVDEFTGALPESQVRAWLNKVVPSETDQQAEAAVALEASNPQRAIELYREVLSKEPRHAKSLLGLGRVLTLQGDPEAEEVLRQVPVGTPEYPRAQALIALAGFLASAETEAPISELGNGLAAHWKEAASEARKGCWEEALECLFQIVQRDRSWNDDAARKVMLSIFALLGNGDPLVTRYRQRLASVLFG
jgi:putative thioredoxin